MSKMANRIRLDAAQSRAYANNTQLQELSAFIERALSNEHKRRTDEAQKKLSVVTDESDQAFLAACYAEDIFEIERDFPRIQRYALFVAAMSTMEANVVSLCRAAKRIFCLTTEFDEKPPGVIDRGVKYLQKKMSLNLSSYQDYITLADNLRRVRNCITHSEGRLIGRPDAEKIRSFVITIPTIEVDSREYIVLHAGFVETTIHEMNELIVQLYEMLSKNITAQQLDLK